MPDRACMCGKALGCQLYCLNVVDGVRVTSSDKNTSTISSSLPISVISPFESDKAVDSFALTIVRLSLFIFVPYSVCGITCYSTLF